MPSILYERINFVRKKRARRGIFPQRGPWRGIFPQMGVEEELTSGKIFIKMPLVVKYLSKCPKW